MTDKARLAALEAVAEAAANYRKARLNDHPDMIVTSKRSQLYNALDARELSAGSQQARRLFS